MRRRLSGGGRLRGCDLVQIVAQTLVFAHMKNEVTGTAVHAPWNICGQFGIEVAWDTGACHLVLELFFYFVDRYAA